MNYDSFYNHLQTTLPANVASALIEATRQAIDRIDHGDYPRWQQAINTLPNLPTGAINLSTDTVTIGHPEDAGDQTRLTLQAKLMHLHPWRKGPFEIAGLKIDTEWRSDLKWRRIKDQIAPLTNRRILDVGCGNGYYLFRMLAENPAIVVGIDPFLLYVMQFHALNHYIQTDKAAVLPLGIEDFPIQTQCFDTVLSMGVLYHRKDPLEHLSFLANQLIPTGQLVLETLVLDTQDHQVLKPKDRYAKMRNVWNIPSPPAACHWLEQTGFTNIHVADLTHTTSTEQRRTDWMRFESLPDFLDPSDPTRTIEGYPAPVRAVILAEKR